MSRSKRPRSASSTRRVRCAGAARGRSEPAALAAVLRRRAPDLARAVLESGALSGWLCGGLVEAGLPALCIDARAAHGALKQRRSKSDRGDAEVLARLAQTGWFRVVRLERASPERHALLAARERLVRIQRDLPDPPAGEGLGSGPAPHHAAPPGGGRSGVAGRDAGAAAGDHGALDRALARRRRAGPALTRSFGRRRPERADPGLDLPLRRVPVAHQAPAALLVREFSVSAWAARNASTSASIPCASIRRAPSRGTASSGSACRPLLARARRQRYPPQWRILLGDMNYH